MLDTTLENNHMEVFFIDGSTGWAAAEFDANGCQQGDSEFVFHKRDAVKVARVISQGVMAIHVFGKDGTRQPNAKTSSTI